MRYTVEITRTTEPLLSTFENCRVEVVLTCCDESWRCTIEEARRIASLGIGIECETCQSQCPPAAVLEILGKAGDAYQRHLQEGARNQ